MSGAAQSSAAAPLAGVLDPYASCGDVNEFEALIQAQLASQLSRSQARVRERDRPTASTMDPAVASKALHSAGALKTYKPDRVTANAKLETLTAAQLRIMLKQQQSMLANPALLKSLPDGGARIHVQVAAIEAQLQRYQVKEEAQMGDVERMLGQVSLAGTVSGDGEDDGRAAASAASFTVAPTSASAAFAASSSSSITAASSIPASAAASSSSSNGSIGRGSAATALHCASDVVNARIQRDTRANIESKFRRAPPTVLSAEEATRLMKAKDDDWNALMSNGAGFGERHSHLALNAAYRDPRAGFEDDDEDDDGESQLSDESEDDDAELEC